MQERPRPCSRLRRFRRWPFAAVLSLFALATPGGLNAQPWSGASTLGVQIRGAGRPVEGAVVEIRHRRPGLHTGPEARRTDSRGQANFIGIINGRWSLEIKHPEYLSFVASINVQRGKKPEIVTQFLEASGPGRGTLRVKFLRSDQPFGEVIAGTAVTERPLQPAPAQPPPVEAAALERPVSMPAPAVDRPVPEKTEDGSRVDSRAVPSTVVTPPPQPPAVPASEPQGEAPSTAESEEKAPTLTAEVPTPLERPVERPAPIEVPVEVPDAEPIAPPRPLVEAAAAEPAMQIPPETQPEEDREPASVPTPAELEAPEPDDLPPPAPAPPPPPASVPSSLRAYRDRTCFECKPGEWAVSTQLEVASGVACRPTAEVAVRRAMRDVAAVASDQLGNFSGPLPLDLDTLPLAAAAVAARNTLAPYLESSASCRFLAVVVPQGGRFLGFRFEARDADASGDCTGERECEIGQARFLFSPGIARGTGASIVYSLFENTSSAARTARLTGFFLPASGWAPE